MANRHINQRITADIVPMEIPQDADDQDDENMDMFQVPLLKRNLLGDFGRPSFLDAPVSEHMKVFLRIRPFSEEETAKQENQCCLTVESSRTVATHAPKDSHYYKNTVRGFGKTTTKFEFSHIFGEKTTQKEFFNDTMLGLVKDFIDGQNCLVFSYGVTSSGKTYTIQGEPKDAGILPRALDVLFNSIHGRQWEGMNLKPEMFTNVTRLTADQELMERKIKERVLKLSCDNDMDVMSLLGDDAADISSLTNTTSCSESSNMSTMDNKDSLDGGPLFEELNERVREEAKVSVETQGQIKFSVWVSFAEIYNEQIFDLLEPLPKKKNARRTCLKVCDDQNGSPYIKGLKCINVNSADEAYKLLTIGQRNLKTACTKLNQNSSRSHCIFNIKILRLVDKEDPHVARVSMLTLCDLAGSERYSKTMNTGERLREAGNINTSLLTLGRCIETLKYNQNHKDNTRMIPFRESKLTRLFQNFFVGRGKAAMVVNVNQCASMFDETQHVFKFSAIATQVVVQQKPVFIRPRLPLVVASPNPIPRASISWATPARNKVPLQKDAENVPLPEDDDDLDAQPTYTQQSTYTQHDVDELLRVIEQSAITLERAERANARLETEIRKEVCEEMMKQFIEIEEQCGEQIRIREQMAEELAEKRMQILIEAERAKRKKGETMTDEDDEWVSSIVMHQEKVKVEKRDKTIQTQKEEIEGLNKRLAEMSENQDKLQKEKRNLETQLEDVETKLKTSIANGNNELSPELEGMRNRVTEYEVKIQSLEKELSKRPGTEDTGKADLVENLSQQITQSRQQIKEQESEISELNDMLTEAGETFQQKEKDIAKLKELVQEYEKKLEAQSEAIKVLERAASDSKVAMETADQSLSKREDCVSTLQAEIRDLEGEVNKYRNKARFFEEQLVEKEQESSHWKNKYDQDREEYAKNQEALIHGFKAEISNLKSQIFHFKSQLYGVKSPLKSPGSSMKSPSAKMRLFSMLSPSKSPQTYVDASSSMCVQESPVEKAHDDKDHFKHDVNQQVKALQNEMDKNCAMIAELEHALQISKSAVQDLEKKLQSESGKHSLARNRIEELESQLGRKDDKTGSVVSENKDEVEVKNDKKQDNFEKSLQEKIEELEKANEKIKELEPLMKDYFSTAKKLTDSEKMVNSLNEVVEDKSKEVSNLENRLKQLEDSVKNLTGKLQEKEAKIEKIEERKEELECLNGGLKEMVNKTTIDLETKEIELQILSPKAAEKLQQSADTDSDNLVERSAKNMLSVIDNKNKEMEKVKSKLSKLREGYKAKDEFLKEASDKCKELEFRIDEKEIEDQDLKKQLEDCAKKMEALQVSLNEKVQELVKTGEEIAILSMESETGKRLVTEYKAEMLKQKEETKLINERLNKAIKEKNELSELMKNKDEVRIELVKLKEAVTNANIKAEELQKMLNVVIEKNAELEEKSAKYDEIREEMMKLEELMKVKDEKIIELSEKIESIEREKTHDISLKRHTEDEVEKLKETIKEKDEEIAMFSQNLNAVLEEKENEERVGQAIEELKKRLVESEQKLKGKEEQVGRLMELQHDQESEKITLQKEQLMEKESLIRELQCKIENISKNIIKNEDLEVSVHDLESAVVDKEVELHEKDNIIEEKNREVENLRLELKKMEKELNYAEEKVTVAEKGLVEQRNKFDETLAKQQREKEENVVEQEKIFRKMEQYEKKIDDRNLRICELKEELEKADEKIEDFEKLLEKHKDDLDEKKSKLESSQNELKNLNAKLTESFDKNCRLEDIIEEKTNQLNELRTSYEELKENNSNNDGNDSDKLSNALLENAELKSTIHANKTSHHKLKGELQDAQLEVENNRSKIERLSGEVDKQHTQLKGAEHELEQSRSEIERLKVENEIRNTELVEAQSQLEVVGILEDKVTSIESVVTDLKEQVRIKAKDADEKLEALQQNEQCIEKLKQVIKEKEDEIKELGQELNDRDVKTKDLEQTHEASRKQTQSATNVEMEELKQKLDGLKSEKKEMSQRIKTQVDDLMRLKEENLAEVKLLGLKVDELKNENRSLSEEMGEIKKSKDSENDLKSQLTLKEVECETLKLELKVLKDDLAKEMDQCKVIREKLQELQKLYESEESEKSDIVCDNINLEKLKELERKLEAEKLRNEEYRKIMDDTSEMKCFSPQTGVRKLRKEKIETENALLEAKFKIASLESKVKGLETKRNLDFDSNKPTDNNELVPSHDPLLQRKLNKVVSKLQETETTNRSLIKEVTELQSSVERLETRLEEAREKHNMPAMEQEIHRRSRASFLQAADPRQSISSPSTKEELTKSRDREHKLHEQLTKANITIQEWLGKLSDTENKLQQKTQELKHARDTVHCLEARTSEEGKNKDREIQEYMGRNNELQLQILKKEGELDAKSRIIEDLRRQLDAEIGDMKMYEKDKQQKDEMIALLKETLKDQENMLQVQEDFINSKEADLNTSESEYKELLSKYQNLLESRDVKQNDRLEETRSSARAEAERDLLRQQLKEAEQKLERALVEKDKMTTVVKENNQELKEMERSLTESRRQCEELRSHGADKCAETRLEEVRRDMDKTVHDLHTKVRTLQCENKEVSFKLSATQEKLKTSMEDKHGCDNRLKEFREERDKLVSGLEAVLKKKDVEIKQHKDLIKQLKEKEIHITKSWQEERDKIAAGLSELHGSKFTVKTEPVHEVTSPSRQEEETEMPGNSPKRQNSRGRPPRPAQPKNNVSIVDTPCTEKTEIQTLDQSPSSSRRTSRTPGSTTMDSSQKRPSSRRGKKRTSPVSRDDDLPPKRRSVDTAAESSMMSEMSDDYSSHIQIDATPSVAARSLKKMRKKTGSTADISKTEESETSMTAPRRPQRSAKKSAKSRIFESFRESPMGKTGKRILENIAETFSPSRSPTKSPKKDETNKSIETVQTGGKRSHQSSKENISNECPEVQNKPRGRLTGTSKGRHKLYKEETYISEPFENTGDFIQPSPDNIHQTVTRSLRSRRH